MFIDKDSVPYVWYTSSIGTAKNSIPEHVLADIPLQSDRTPAIIAPTMPPKSNNVDKSALPSAPRVAELKKKTKTFFNENRQLSFLKARTEIYTRVLVINFAIEKNYLLDDSMYFGSQYKNV